jgi:hypothetical protein
MYTTRTRRFSGQVGLTSSFPPRRLMATFEHYTPDSPRFSMQGAGNRAKGVHAKTDIHVQPECRSMSPARWLFAHCPHSTAASAAQPAVLS